MAQIRDRSHSLYYERKTHYKITVMGGAGVGKSCLISRFLYDKFAVNYRETIEDLHRGEFEIDGMKLILDILDTSGSHEFPAMRKLAISTSDAFILVYTLGDMSSFEDVKNLRSQILSEKGNEHIPGVVVANKCDMAKKSDRKIVSTLVEFEWRNGYIEASAKEDLNVVRIFKELLKLYNSEYTITKVLKVRRKSMPASLNHADRRSRKSKRHNCPIS